MGVRRTRESRTSGRAGLPSREPATDTSALGVRSVRWTIEGRCLCGEIIQASLFEEKASAAGWVRAGLDLSIEAHLLHCPRAAEVRRLHRTGW